MECIKIPWPHPGQKVVAFTPGRIYFSIALTIGLPHEAGTNYLRLTPENVEVLSA